MTYDTLLSSQARQGGIFQTAEVERLLRVHRSGRRDHSARLWALLCFELWMRRWAGERPAADRGVA
jgi:asparagine synthase (glutamine-hydrolysing)